MKIARTENPFKRGFVCPACSRSILIVECPSYVRIVQSRSITLENMKRKTARVMLVFALHAIAPSFKYSCPSEVFWIVRHANPTRLVIKILAQRNRIFVTNCFNRIRTERDDRIGSENQCRHSCSMDARV
jgi:hypothetical protein